ncbi:EVE domain-containing protein [Sporomusa silvacetica]
MFSCKKHTAIKHIKNMRPGDQIFIYHTGKERSNSLH